MADPKERHVLPRQPLGLYVQRVRGGHYTEDEAKAEAQVEPWRMTALRLSDVLQREPQAMSQLSDEIRRTTAEGLTHAAKQQELSPLLRGYTEGTIHGFELATDYVRKQTNGLFTLVEPQEITEARARLKRSKRGSPER